MTKEHIKRIHFVYGILLSIILVIAGICLMAGCIVIYHSGDHPFSRESVAEVFSGIALPVYLCLGMVVAGFVLDLILPEEKTKKSVDKQYSLILKRLWERTDTDAADPGLLNVIHAQQRSRKLHKRISGILLILGSAVFLCYGLNINNFHKSEINASMIAAVKVLIPCMLLPFGYGVFAAYHSSASIRKEIELLKTAAKKASVPASAKPSELLIGRCAVLAVAVSLLCYGFIAGGTADVLTKAVNICTECVGLG